MKRLLATLFALTLWASGAAATPQVAAQATASAATLTATAAAVANLAWYISGFSANCGGATVALSVQGTLTGLIGGNVDFVVSTGAAVGGPSTVVMFPTPVPAPVNTAVVLSWVTLGTGSICAGTIFGELR